MPNDQLPLAISLTKRNAALRQTIVAIDQFQKGFYDCAITLAGAAEGMLPENDKAVHLKILDDVGAPELADTFYTSFDRKQRNTFWNAQRDWLKHLTPQLPGTMEIGRSHAEHMIVRAITKLDPTPEEMAGAALQPLMWFFQAYFRKTDEDIAAELEALRGSDDEQG